jgi:hypothetical protein
VLGWLEQHRAPSFAPRLWEWRDVGEAVEEAAQGSVLEAVREAVLVLEDLSSATWPPPFPGDTGPIFEALERLAEVEAPPELEPLESWDPDPRLRWSMVTEDPGPFLGLGVCSSAWLEANIAALLAAEQRVDLRGSGLVHNDIYSGNLCFIGPRVVFVDWANAARGNHCLDVAFAIVTVLSEGGRLPTGLTIPDEGAWAARLAGHNAVEAAAPLPGWAEPGSTLRQEQLADLRVALGWAARGLSLDPPN